MSWGDQIVDEFGIFREKHERMDKLDKNIMMLYSFAIWLVNNKKLSANDSEVEKMIDEFLTKVQDVPATAIVEKNLKFEDMAFDGKKVAKNPGICSYRCSVLLRKRRV